ncbi:MAG TPA: hypothetical protein VE619_01310 [Nitrososphaeraceae archaeon]|nr:hypothetical protein [Nitrososphaeraceae archaeon]
MTTLNNKKILDAINSKLSPPKNTTSAPAAVHRQIEEKLSV